MSKLIDIKNEALKHYETFLSGYVGGRKDSFFPLELRFSKPQRTDDRSLIKEKIDYLEKNSKNIIGWGYDIEWEPKGSRAWNELNIPTKVYFSDELNFLKFIGKDNEYNEFKESLTLINSQIPELNEWIKDHPMEVVKNNAKWLELLKVCSYFISEHLPDKYFIRELPILGIHTKFIEDNEGIVRKLLDFLIPNKINNDKNFQLRYSLKSKERLVRIRLLCPDRIRNGTYSDFSIRFSDFIKTEIQCDSIIIAENELNFLTFPPKRGFIALWNGGGHNIHDLPRVDWLKDKKTYYFGDLDVAGLDILSKFRKYYPSVQSIMMNKSTFNLFYDGGISNKIIKGSIDNLNGEERELLEIVRPKNLRLEQERISQDYINQIIGDL